MRGVIEIELQKFILIYIVLLIILFIMKKFKIKQEKLLLIASTRMSVQLIIAGYILTYIMENPSPIFTMSYFAIMVIFAIYRTINKNPQMNRKFKMITALSLLISGTSCAIFFIYIVIGESMFNPQYTIPISGMLLGNAMNGTSLAIKSFYNLISGNSLQIKTLLNLGIHPEKILFPFLRDALETAFIPTLNSMLGMGIVSLPGMMTGQILSGTLPKVAILYQISITLIITTIVCVSCFGTLYFGQKTLWNKDAQINI